MMVKQLQHLRLIKKSLVVNLAIWLDRAFELEAGSVELAFNDVADRYEEAVKALVNNKITNGTSATTFGTTDSAKRGDFALFIYRAANVEKLPVTPATPVVESVDAVGNGNTTIKVAFSEAIDATTLIANGKLKANTLTVVDEDGVATPVTGATLSPDKKTLTLTAASFEGEKFVKVAFEAIKSTDGDFVSPSSTKVVIDTTAPTFTSAIGTYGSGETKATTLKLTFSEKVIRFKLLKLAQNHILL